MFLPLHLSFLVWFWPSFIWNLRFIHVDDPVFIFFYLALQDNANVVIETVPDLLAEVVPLESLPPNFNQGADDIGHQNVLFYMFMVGGLIWKVRFVLQNIPSGVLGKLHRVIGLTRIHLFIVVLLDHLLLRLLSNVIGYHIRKNILRFHLITVENRKRTLLELAGRS
jgi:hypothetical protein